MEVVDKIDTEKQIEQFTEEQKDDLFTKLIMGKDATEIIKTSRGEFVVKHPKANDFIRIGKLAAVRRNYKPAEGFDVETEMLNTMVSTLDVVVVSGPEWFEKAKKTNQNFSFLEVPSRAFLAELYGKAYTFREKVEQSFSEGEENDQRVSSETSDDDAVDGGAFGGLSSE